MLISAVLPIMTLYRLPHGQYGYVINLPQHVASFANSLPCLPSDLDVIVVRKEDAAQSHHDFRVRRSRVLSALQWLQDNNIYYCSISISPDALALCLKMVTYLVWLWSHFSPPVMTTTRSCRLKKVKIPIMSTWQQHLFLSLDASRLRKKLSGNR